MLSLLTVLGQILIILLVISFFVHKREGNFLLNFFKKYAFIIAFIVALASTLGSLFYSDIAGYEPCKLCWFQRIFMYPQAIILGMALWRKDKNIGIYSLVLSVVGAIIAGYHYLLQLGIAPSLPCSAVGYSVSCSQRFIMEYGYITIPMMSLTAFVLIIIAMMISQNVRNGDNIKS
ncbi:MAG: disulfide oxidoreductase [Patescibacteria group bacterium]